MINRMVLGKLPPALILRLILNQTLILTGHSKIMLEFVSQPKF